MPLDLACRCDLPRTVDAEPPCSLMADPSPCPACGGDPHPDRECRPEVAAKVADILIDHPELKGWAAMRIEIAELRDQLHLLRHRRAGNGRKPALLVLRRIGVRTA